jgi:hypothetical protein
MKGPRELKRYIAKNRKLLKSRRFDDLLIFKLETCKKYRNQNRRPRDGYYAR